jgi:hypothetical protein
MTSETGIPYSTYNPEEDPIMEQPQILFDQGSKVPPDNIHYMQFLHTDAAIIHANITVELCGNPALAHLTPKRLVEVAADIRKALYEFQQAEMSLDRLGE